MKILCFGDSNTWGYIPGSFNQNTGKFQRYQSEKCWPQQLARSDSNYQVIEDALCGRTTNIDDPEWPDRNGLTHLCRALETHTPIDALIIMLGTNDFKYRLSRSANDVAKGIEMLALKAKETDFINHSIHKIFVIIPPIIKDENLFDGEFFNAVNKSKALKNELIELAATYALHLIDASDICASTIDGIHLDERGHDLVAEKVISSVKSHSCIQQPTSHEQLNSQSTTFNINSKL